MSKSKRPSLTAGQEREIMQELLRREEALSQRKVASQPNDAELEAVTKLLSPADPVRRTGMFPQQREFFFDSYENGKHRLRVARCTRRSGKTTGAAIKILVTILRNPRAMCLYVAKSTTIVKDQIWPELHKIVAEYDLPFAFHETELRMYHTRSTGRAIFRGAGDMTNISKLRGLGIGGNFVLAILDESGHFGAGTEQLVVGGIGPGLRDRGGEMLLIGTPGDYPDGLFYAASEGLLPNWTRRRWTLQDNPFLDAHAKDPKVIQDEEGLSSDDALYIREYLGEYALNVKTQMFEFDPRKNTFLHDGKVPEGYQVYLGVDFGWVDESAIVAVAWSEMTKKMYVLESWAASQQDSDMMAARILDFKNRYAPRRILGDVGGYGKGMSGPIFNNYGLYIEPAQKLDKLNHLQFVNSAFARGELMINAADPIVQELPKVLWNDKRSDAHNKAKDNRSMAMVYAVYPALQQHGKLAEVKSLSELVGGGWPEDELRAKLGASVPGEHQTATDWFLNNF
jgi:hypothetical protein